MSQPIDFVLTWVDDRDDEWRARRDHYRSAANIESGEAASSQRYRDWDLLRFWFRSVDAYAPWVRYIYLVTENRLPEWLEQSHPKLRIVRHDEFIPHEYLPTFNSRAIELNLHRIADLSENFVYFNDDAFLLQPTPPEHFFRDGLPVSFAIGTALTVSDNLSHAMLNNVGVINRNFSKRKVMAKHLRQWFTIKYGAKLIQNMLLLAWPRFTGFHVHHLPQALTRSAMQRIWSAAPDVLEHTSQSRFRRLSDVNPFLVSWWMICEGRFSPGRLSQYGLFLPLHDSTLGVATQAVRRGATRVVCLNDGTISDFEAARSSIQLAFQARFPHRSAFEVDGA